MTSPCAEPGCPMDGILRILSGPWTTYILWCLRNEGSLRFGELKAQMPAISSKVLTERLRMLEGAQLVHRDYKPTIPPAVSYSLTARGTELKDVLDALAVLGTRWQEEDVAPTIRRRVSGTRLSLPGNRLARLIHEGGGSGVASVA